MKGDFKMWLQFLNHSAAYAWDFMDFRSLASTCEIEMYSDASKLEVLGFGGICGTSWMFAPWPKHFITDCDPSIAFLELFALIATVINWIHHFQNQRIILFCDNQSVVQMVNNTTSACPNCMYLIRKMVLKCLIENVRVYAKYIKSKDNTASDCLSRLKIDQFLQLKNNWDRVQTPVPQELWPISKVWNNFM